MSAVFMGWRADREEGSAKIGVLQAKLVQGVQLRLLQRPFVDQLVHLEVGQDLQHDPALGDVSESGGGDVTVQVHPVVDPAMSVVVIIGGEGFRYW